MSREYRNKSIVSGKTIQDILNIDISTFNKLNTSELRKVVGRLVSAGNKRLRSFEKAGETSPAIRYINESGGKFSTRGKDLNQLRAEFTRAKTFLQSKTGTRKGWISVKKQTIKSLKEQGVNIEPNEFDKVWKAYEKLKEIAPEIANKQFKYKSAMREIAELVSDGDKNTDEIVMAVYRDLAQRYEEQEELENGTDGVSEFFEI